MNAVFQKLLKENSTALKPFLQFYIGKYGANGLAAFQEMPFTFQLGIYLEYFETIYNLIIIVNTKGYSIQFSDDRKTPIRGENNMFYNHYRYEYNEPKSIIFGYECGIIWLFTNYDLPF